MSTRIPSLIKSTVQLDPNSTRSGSFLGSVPLILLSSEKKVCQSHLNGFGDLIDKSPMILKFLSSISCDHIEIVSLIHPPPIAEIAASAVPLPIGADSESMRSTHISVCPSHLTTWLAFRA